MLVECGTLWEELRGVFKTISEDAIGRANSDERWKRWTFEELAGMSGREVDEWRDGCARAAIQNRGGRLRLLTEFGLWTKADMEDHIGILFTADPDTGVGWDVHRIGDRAARDGEYMMRSAGVALAKRPSAAKRFRGIKQWGGRLVTAGQRLLLLPSSDPEDEAVA